MECLCPAVLTGLMACCREHDAAPADGVPSMRDLAVTASTRPALRAGYLVPVVSAGPPAEWPRRKTPNRRGRADFAPAAAGGTESGLCRAESRKDLQHKNQYFDPYFCAICLITQNNRLFQGAKRVFSLIS